MAKNALLEIGTEEIPASYIVPALEQMKKNADDMLNLIGLKFDSITTYSTPRRLVLILNNVAEKSEDKIQEFNGPAVKAGKDANGNWTQAVVGFSKKHNITPEQLTVKDTDKGQYYCHTQKIKGIKAQEALSNIFPELIKKIYFPKTMVWESSLMKFARPVRSIVAMYGDKIVKFSLANDTLKSSNKTIGLHALTTKPVVIDHVDNYKTILQNNCVLIDQSERKNRILASISEVVNTISCKAILDDELIDEVNQLVEHPTAVLCKFDEKYLKLPAEVLITCMKKKQKCFAVKDENGKLTNYFIGIRNGKSEHQNIVREGYQKVVVARLADSEFFYDNDLKKTLDSSLERLKGLVFQKEIGTVYEKLSRIKNLAQFITTENNLSCDTNKINTAVDLSKTDLVSEMVFEYPELQGIIGRIYANVAGQPQDISQAIEQHYWPLSASGKLPENLLSAVVSLADKIDTLSADFAIGFEPSGSADPYGLRRMAIGIIRMIVEYIPNANIEVIIDESLNNLPEKIKQLETFKNAKERLIKFFWNRIENIYENDGYKFDEVKAIILPAQKNGFNNLGDIKIKLSFLHNARKQSSFESIITIFKRANNIVQQAKKQKLQISEHINSQLLKEEPEQKLYNQYNVIDKQLKELLADKNYSQALNKLNDIKPHLDNFFENVMVMCDDNLLKLNRISLISGIIKGFDSFVDLSVLQ
ncbi:MAG: glycine--tRNA ligase subunit beta [Endomicrobiaceae bacterium]|nr:glycine--tRNA ligase subunit beta [Endomicrobiaceae bacterium]